MTGDGVQRGEEAKLEAGNVASQTGEAVRPEPPALPEPPTVRPVRPALPARPRRRPPVAWSPRRVRLTLLAGAAALASVFGVAACLNPYQPDGTPRRMGTHRQLGMPPCNFVTLFGKPCPSCGMTTSFALLVRGDLRGSLQANWVGTLLACSWAAALVWALLSAAAGRMLLVRPHQVEMCLTAAVAVFVVLMLGRWLAVLLG